MEPANKQPPEEGDWFTRQHVLVLVLLAATVLALYLCYQMAVPFLSVFTWALALAVVTHPVHDWVRARVKQPDVAAGLTTVVVALLIVGPAVFVVHLVVGEIAENFETVRAQIEAGTWLRDYPWLARAWAWAQEHFDVPTELRNAFAGFFGSVTNVLSGSVWMVVQLLLILFTLFFFLRDRHLAVDAVRSLVPLSGAEARQVFSTVRDTIYATIYGAFVVALIQGTLGGLMFWFLGLPAPVLWGAVMTLLAVIPNLGAFVVWVPAAVFLFMNGNWGKGLILTAWGGGVVATIDNILYPYLVGNRMRLHTLAVFFAILGGVSVFGAAGIVLGPTVLAVTLALLDVWRRRTAAGGTAESAIITTEIVPGKDAAIRDLAAPAAADAEKGRA